MPGSDGGRDFRSASRKAHPEPGQAADGENAARILLKRADEGDPERARRRRWQGRSNRDRGAHQIDEALQRSARQSDRRAEKLASNVADVSRSDSRAELS